MANDDRFFVFSKTIKKCYPDEKMILCRVLISLYEYVCYVCLKTL